MLEDDIKLIDRKVYDILKNEAIWNAWERIKMGIEELARQTTNSKSMPCCSKCKSERVTVICNDCGFKHCM